MGHLEDAAVFLFGLLYFAQDAQVRLDAEDLRKLGFSFVNAQDLRKMYFSPPMRNICTVFAQDCTSLLNELGPLTISFSRSYNFLLSYSNRQVKLHTIRRKKIKSDVIFSNY